MVVFGNYNTYDEIPILSGLVLYKVISDFNQTLAKAELPRQTVHKCLYYIPRVVLFTSKDLDEYICTLLPHQLFLVKHEHIKRNSVLNIPMTSKKSARRQIYPPLLHRNLHHRCIGTTTSAKSMANMIMQKYLIFTYC